MILFCAAEDCYPKIFHDPLDKTVIKVYNTY